jgi:hypothetical protein
MVISWSLRYLRTAETLADNLAIAYIPSENK